MQENGTPVAPIGAASGSGFGAPTERGRMDTEDQELGPFGLYYGCRTHWGGKAPRRLPLLLSTFLASLALLFASAPSASALPEKFFGVHWSPYQSAADMEAVARSGAKYYHLQISQTTNVAAAYDPIFQLAWEQGITILPYLYGKSVQPGSQFPTLEQLEKEGSGPGTWIYFLYDVVHRYGFQGDFWYGKSNPRPAPEWEIWNEPNFRENNPGGLTVQPENYTRFASRTAVAIQAAQKERSGGGTRVNFGNLFSAATCKDGANCGEGSNYKSMNVGLFLEKAKKVDPNGVSFTGLALHPYSFASGRVGVETNVNFAREKLNQFFGGSTKELWITELGWLAEGGDASHPAFGEAVQAQNLTESFNWIRSVQAANNIQSLVYFNYHDFVAPNPSEKWAEHAGLRRIDGSFRPALYSFHEQTGAPPPTQLFIGIQANNNSMWGYQSSTGLGFNTASGMLSGTSPSVGYVPGTGYIIAFQSWQNELWLYNASTKSWIKTSLGMAAGTSPSIGVKSDGT